MNIPVKDVLELRNRTGMHLPQCKKALEETGGDLDKAYQYLLTQFWKASVEKKRQ